MAKAHAAVFVDNGLLLKEESVSISPNHKKSEIVNIRKAIKLKKRHCR